MKSKSRYKKRENKRSKQLIADFSKGYADGWAFIVRKCNFESLDIAWSVYKKRDKATKKSKIVYEGWSQGCIYKFPVGATFYDSARVYDNIPWSDAKKLFNRRIQIVHSIPMSKNTDGKVIYELYEKGKGVTTNQCTQKEFVQILKKGVIPALEEQTKISTASDTQLPNDAYEDNSEYKGLPLVTNKANPKLNAKTKTKSLKKNPKSYTQLGLFD